MLERGERSVDINRRQFLRSSMLGSALLIGGGADTTYNLIRRLKDISSKTTTEVEEQGKTKDRAHGKSNARLGYRLLGDVAILVAGEVLFVRGIWGRGRRREAPAQNEHK